jgi:Arc/MetJ-type ribon-helix-helix transcriptional regulator
MDKMHRAQILLEPDQHQKLAEIARGEGASISELVRDAVTQWLNERETDEILHRRLRALEEIAEHRQAILDRRNGVPLEIDWAATIAEMREERDDELVANIFGHRG